MCKENADQWHHVLTTEKRLMLNIALCAECHIKLHRLNPTTNKKFIRLLKKVVGKLDWI